MIQKIFLTLSALLITAIFSACCDPKMVEVPKPYPVPVKCVVPDVNCSWSGNPSQTAEGMLRCIVDQKQAAKVCK